MFLRTGNSEALTLLEDAYAEEFGLSARQPVVDFAGRAHDSRWAGALARLLALGPISAGGASEAIAIIEGAVDRGGLDALTPDTAALFGQLLLRGGEIERLRDILEALPINRESRWALKADSLNPSLTQTAQSPWLNAFNEVFVSNHLEPVTLGCPGAAPFDRLDCEVRDPATGDDLVSVIMPVYRPDDSLFTAVRSILAQSWPNIELIVVDDCSPVEYRSQLLRVQAMDPRIQLIEGRGQLGTYAARNQGLDYAEGDFVAFHDSDDWAHPRRIEQQLAPLLADRRLLATRSRAIRTFQDLTTTCVGYPAIRVNASSLVFRREAVMSIAGYFDSARKSADDEFTERLRAAKPSSVLDMRRMAPLSIAQLTPGSLSRDESRPGWLHWGRVAYRNAYRSWHREIAAGVSCPYLDGAPASRPFPLPDESWAPIRQSWKLADRYDVVLVNDWRSGREPICLSAVHAAVALARSGLRVAVSHSEVTFPLARQREPLSAAVQAPINSGVLDIVHRSQEVRASLALVCTPLLSHTARPLPSSWEIDSVVDLPQDPEEGLANPKSTSTDPDALQLSRVVIPELTATCVPRCNRDRPVAGRIAPDADRYWSKHRRELLKVYSRTGSLDLRVLGAVEAALEVIGQSQPPAAWTHFRPGQVPPRDFLAQLDFYLHYPGRDIVARPHRGVLEATASGCVPVLPPEMALTYGDAAIYCEPRDLGKRLTELWSRPAMYRKQQRLGAEWVRECATTETFVDAVAGLAT